MYDSDLDDDFEKSVMDTNLIKFSQLVDMQTKTKKQELIITDFLSILDLKRLQKILQIKKSFENQIKNILS